MAVDKRRIADDHTRADPRGLTQQRIDNGRRLIKDLLAVADPLRGLRCLRSLGIEDDAQKRQLDHARHGNQQQTLW